MGRAQLVFHSKRGILSASIPKSLFDRVRQRAKSAGLPYKRYIRYALERAVAQCGQSKAKAGYGS
jgi:predicted DNA binding CopG/RHH family protein